MRSLMKTALIAAAGVAVVAASPALAASKRSERSAVIVTPGAVYGYAPGYQPYYAPGPFYGDPGAAQIQQEYLKDAPMHNGNAY